MANVSDVSKDIYHVLDSAYPHDPDADLAAEYAMRIGGEMAKATRPRSSERGLGKLWASDLGEACSRKTYYKFLEPQHGEALMGHTKFKFLYGNLLEEAVLYLAEEAGHKVEGQQNPVKVAVPDRGEWVVSGRIDAVVDNVLLDVKSTSSFGYKKYQKEGLNKSNDSFGYLWQLGYYHHFLEEIPNRKEDEAGFLWIDKQNGHVLYNDVTSHLPSKDAMFGRMKQKVDTIELGEEPIRPYKGVPEGKSGNMKLDIKCSYCDFKKHCWRDANGGVGLRTFLYGYGPQHLVEVTREPRVQELK